mgnify:CR=1 FL=1
MNIRYISLIFLLFLSLTSFGTSKNLKGKGLSDSTIVIINDVVIGGNKKTIKKVILRELMFERGDTVYQENLEKLIKASKQNLLNTLLDKFILVKAEAYLSPRLGGNNLIL